MKIPYVFKKCKRCGKWLVASTFNFHKKKSGKYGIMAECKECRSAYKKKWYEENKEEILEKQKKYNEEHKEEASKHKKKWYEKNKEKILEKRKIYWEENKEKIADYKKKYYKTPQGQVVNFNTHNNRRRKREQQGNGITADQWLEMMKFFGFKCAYSGEYIGGRTNTNRTIDHIVPLAKGGAHEVWNCVPMYGSYNFSKRDKDIKEWYPQQDFYNEDRLNKINEWREYAYNKWSNKVNTKTI